MSITVDTVGLVYPPGIHTDPEGQAAAAARLASSLPDLQVLIEPWVDTADQRTRRSSPGYVRDVSDHTAVSPRQARLFEQVDAVLALDLPFDVAEVAPRLKWVQSVSTGVGQLRSAGLAEAGVLLTNAAGTAAAEIAEFVVARILQHVKRLPEIDRLQAETAWRPVRGSSLAGRTIGLVGFGAINRRVASLASAFDMRILVCRRSPGPHEEPFVSASFAAEELTEMVRSCDVVVAALPETPMTHEIIDHRVFEAMKPGAFFCNVGRGSSVVDAALTAALDSGHLGGAALDVFTTEPLAADSPYWRMESVRVSAHCASDPDAAIGRVLDLFAENIRRLRGGRPALNVIDAELGY